MAEESGHETHDPTAIREEHFDADSVRRILQRAAEEQHRLDHALSDAYSRAELEEMADETGISREALSAAIEADRRLDKDEARVARPTRERRTGWIGWLESRLPASWPPPVKRAALVSGGTVALFWLLISLPVIGPVVLWAAVLVLVVITLLLLLGVSFV